MNYKRELWYIHNDFYSRNQIFRQEIEHKIEGEKGVIECPKIFNGSEINQTKIFRSRFLAETSLHCSSEANPEEIELDL